jgi:hypothetical protein
VGPLIVPGWEGSTLLTAKVRAILLAQLLLATTEILPEVKLLPNITDTDVPVVLVLETNLAPAGKVQV